MRNELNFLHFDMDAFFASVEEKKDPSLHHRPMVVAGQSRRAVVTTANYMARRYGIHSAMPLYIAKNLCPTLVVRPVDKKAYRKESQTIFRLLSAFSPLIEKMSIDEGCLDLSHRDDDPVLLARQIQKKIYTQTKLTLSIGISYTRSLAKMAAEWHKPQGIFVITKNDMPQILFPLSVDKVQGIGPKSVEKLARKNIHTIEDLYALSENTLIALFGKHGQTLYERIRGEDHESLCNHRIRKSLGTEETLEVDEKDPENISRWIYLFSEEIEMGLQKYKMQAKTVTLKLKFKTGHLISRSYTFDNHTNACRDFYRAGIFLFDQIAFDEPIRLIGLSVSHLTTSEIKQLCFLDPKNI